MEADSQHPYITAMLAYHRAVACRYWAEAEKQAAVCMNTCPSNEEIAGPGGWGDRHRVARLHAAKGLDKIRIALEAR